jgi:hypothetical protein
MGHFDKVQLSFLGRTRWISRRGLSASNAGAGPLARGPLPGRAQGDPDNIARIIVPFAPGGASRVVRAARAGHDTSQ